MKYVTIIALAKAILLKEVPKPYYEGMKLLNPNTGMTSLVFEKDKDTVRIFTKDEMKMEWLTHEWGIQLGKYIGKISGTKYKDIYIIDMPKLYPVTSDENKKVINKIIKIIKECGGNTLSFSIDNLKKKIKEETGKTKNLLSKFYRSIIKSRHCFAILGLDVSKRNFMETKRGKLIMLDPVSDRELLTKFRLDRLFRRER